MTSANHPLLERLDCDRAAAESALATVVDAIKRQKARSPETKGPGPEVQQGLQKLAEANERFGAALTAYQDAVGISEDEIRQIEAAMVPASDELWWRSQIEEMAPTTTFDALAPAAIRALLAVVPQAWLSKQRTACRLGAGFLNNPLNIVGGVRLAQHAFEEPHYYAHMLCAADDYLRQRDDADFFMAARSLPELSVLGSRLPLVERLGNEAVRRFKSLSRGSGDGVLSTIYELIVGTAFIRNGRVVSMLASQPPEKTPDLRVDGMGAPTVVECKRQADLGDYERAEGLKIGTLFSALEAVRRERGLHGALELEFEDEVATLDPAAFLDSIQDLLSQDSDAPFRRMAWGSAAYKRLPLSGDFRETRLYAPNFLSQVFDWPETGCEWDGLVCAVEPPAGVRVRSFKVPFCIKWRSVGTVAVSRKVRDITRLWAEATEQVPHGEVGLIYIAYNDGQRAALADAKTRGIDSRDRHYDWSIRIPVTVVSRLYSRALGVGVPDFIEAALPGAAEGEEHWLDRVPRRVYEI